MTEVNPCGWLQNAGSTHTAEQLREYFSIFSGGRTGAVGSLIARGGINRYVGNQLSVIPTGSPSMAVVIKSGLALVPGSEGSKQGLYACLNDGDVTLSIGASSPTLNRIDLVVAKVQDSFYSGVTNSWSLAVVAGTPASSPSPPVAPANSIILAQVAIVANDTAINTGDITDTRIYLRPQTAAFACTSATHPTDVVVGDVILETDTLTIAVWNGTLWQVVSVGNTWATYAVSWTSSGTAPAIGNGTLTGRYRYIGFKLIIVEVFLQAGTTTTFGTGVFFFSLPVNPTGGSIQSSRGAATILDFGIQEYGVLTKIEASNVLRLVIPAGGSVSGTSPFGLGNTDSISAQIIYETI